MAELVRENDTLVLRLTPAEKLEGLHGDLHWPVSSVLGIDVVEDVIHAVQGIKMPGSRIPGVFAMGTFMSDHGTVFAIVHHQNRRGVRIRLSGSHFDALVVGADNPEAVIQTLGF